MFRAFRMTFMLNYAAAAKRAEEAAAKELQKESKPYHIFAFIMACICVGEQSSRRTAPTAYAHNARTHGARVAHAILFRRLES
jgi:hypothetical protein